MDGDRKYRQQGYQDSDRGPDSYRQDRPKQNGPKLPLDVTGPKLPRLVQNLVAARCFNCGVTLAPDTNFKGTCPRCGSALHCCKQCVNFDSSTRFQCLKPIPVRIAVKDQTNSCELFSPRVTVARDVLPAAPAVKAGDNGSVAAPRNANDARAAFDNLFKK
ncbi:MAG: hypothetical protein JOY54_16790 [Acidobacteriaceae bacterium]|nr:hypothetical protein [Acidobacteriaceae bacterium]